MASLGETLHRQLLFPLPKSDAVRQDEEPIIPRTHPIHDYYSADNWGGTVGSGTQVNKVVIAPASLSAPFAGLFTAFDQTARGKLQAAVQSSLTGEGSSWRNILTSDESEAVAEKLEAFVKAVAVALTRDVTGEADFDMTSELEPAGYDVFPVPSDGTTALSLDEAKTFQRSTSAYGKLRVAHGSTKADQMFDSMRLYYAYKYIDSVFQAPEEYFFIQRLVMATKMIYVAQILKMAGETAKFDQILGWMYHNSVQYASIDPTSNALEPQVDENGNRIPFKRPEKYALDDMFRRNVELSHDVKEGSLELVQTKDRVSTARDNLQSLANNDELVKTQQFNSKVIYIVVIVLLVAQVAGLVVSQYMGMPMVGYIIMFIFAAIVLVIEATKTLTVLINV